MLLSAWIVSIAYSEQLKLSVDSTRPQDLSRDVQTMILPRLRIPCEQETEKRAAYGLELTRKPLTRMTFWYRQQSRGYLTPTVSRLYGGPLAYTISTTNPPLNKSGMTTVRTDLDGRLIELLAVPEHGKVKRDNPPLDAVLLTALIELTHLDWSDVVPVTDRSKWPSNCTPPVFASQVDVFRDRSGESKQRLLIARNGNQLVYVFAGLPSETGRLSRQFKGYDKVEKANRAKSESVLHALVRILVVLVSVFLALKNMRQGRADFRGALRFALWLAALQALLWIFAFQHHASPARELTLLGQFLYQAVGIVFRFWLAYLAVEPYVRRYWPHVMIAWTRALDGRLRDPLLGRALLLGCTVAVVDQVFGTGIDWIAATNGINLSLTGLVDPGTSLHLAAGLIVGLYYASSWGVWHLMQLLLLRLIIRDTRLVVIAFGAIWTFNSMGDMHLLMLAREAVWFTLAAFVITRWGLLAGMAYVFTLAGTAFMLPTPGLTAWTDPVRIVGMGSVFAVSLYGYYISTIAVQPRDKVAIG